MAAGVAKAGAQTILISGYDGGPAQPRRSSIHNAGLPWELGLAETTPDTSEKWSENRVRLETDGKADERAGCGCCSSFRSRGIWLRHRSPVTMGCVMMSVCNLDTCPVGVATQNPELRKRFRGKPEYVENFMRFIAQELRNIWRVSVYGRWKRW